MTGQWGEGYSSPRPPVATLRNGTLFSPNSGGDLRSDAHQSQIIGGDADVDHTQIIGGDISPHPPPGFGNPPDQGSSEYRAVARSMLQTIFS